MHRLFAATGELESSFPRLDAAEAKHLKVIRPKDGEEIELFDGAGSFRKCVFDARSAWVVPAGDVCRLPRSGKRITLFACITKGERWDWTLEKATELGAFAIVPVVSERTIARVAPGDGARKRERWCKIVREAARQSDAVWIPEVAEPVQFAAAAVAASSTLCFAGALVEPPPPGILRAALSREAAVAPEWSVFIGPEGDFTLKEMSTLLSFAKPVNLGPRILRAETAAICALSILAEASRMVDENRTWGKGEGQDA